MTMTSHQHAEKAGRLLEAQDKLDRKLDNLTEDERLRMAVGGQTARLNRDREFTVAVAHAHALTAIALVLPEFVSRGRSINRG